MKDKKKVQLIKGIEQVIESEELDTSMDICGVFSLTD